jgi:hypothetical protein
MPPSFWVASEGADSSAPTNEDRAGFAGAVS